MKRTPICPPQHVYWMGAILWKLDYEVSKTQLKVLWFMLSRMDDNFMLCYSQSMVAKLAHVNQEVVSKTFVQLQSCGLLCQIHQGGGVYQFHLKTGGDDIECKD